jgi:hypothetical protein
MKCPKCGYQRTEADQEKPKDTCPSCGVIYSKAQAALLKQVAAQQKAKEEELQQREADIREQEAALQAQTLEPSTAKLQPPSPESDPVQNSGFVPPVKKPLIISSFTRYFVFVCIGLPSLWIAISGFDKQNKGWVPFAVAGAVFLLALISLPPIKKQLNKLGGKDTSSTEPDPAKLSPPESPTKIKFFNIANWTFGTIFFLLSLGAYSLKSGTIAVLCFLAIAGLLIPPIRKFIGTKTGLTIPLQARIIAIIVLMFASTSAQAIHFDKLAAVKGGFETVEGYQAARLQGIKTNEAYQKYLAEEKAKKIAELKKKLDSTTGMRPRIDILKELATVDPATYQSQFSQAQEQLKQHEAQIEAEKIARRQREAEEKARKEKERKERTIGVWKDERFGVSAKYTLLKDIGAGGDLIIEFADGGRQSTSVSLERDLDGNLLFRELGNTRGEYYVVMKSSVLAIYDDQGFIASLLPDIGISIK